MCDYQKKMDVEEAVRKLHVLKSGGVALWQRDRDAIETLLAAYYEQKKEIAMLRAYKLDCDAAMRLKTCFNCRNKGSHNGVCDICENMNCWTES